MYRLASSCIRGLCLTFHFHKLQCAMYIVNRYFIHNMKTRSFVDTHGALIEGQDVETEGGWRKLFPCEGQSSINKAQSHSFTRHVGTYAQPDYHDPVVNIERGFARCPW